MEKFLGRVRNKKVAAPTMADVATLIEEVDDLSSWEIVTPSDDEEIEDYSFDEEIEDIFVLESVPSDPSNQSLPHDLIDQINQHMVVAVDRENVSIGDYDDDYHDDDVLEEEEEEEDDDDDGYDVDDELVPRSLSDRFGKQRLLKLGKRAAAYSPKMNSAKKVPGYYYNRPGGVYGNQRFDSKKQKIIRKKSG